MINLVINDNFESDQDFESEIIENLVDHQVLEKRVYTAILKANNKLINTIDIELLKLFLTPFGKIKAREETGATAKTHRKIIKAIKKARWLKLLPFNVDIVEE